MTYVPLIQERLARDADYGWRMLVACVLLNRTRGTVAGQTLDAVLERWPTPALLARAAYSDVMNVIMPCGLWVRRSHSLVALSAA